MKRKDLESMGIEKENIDKIMDWNGADIEAEKAKTAAAEGERDNYKTQLDTATGELDKLKEMKPEEMQATITKLQDDLKAKDDEYAAKETERLFNESLDKAITEAGGRSVKAVRGMLDIAALQESKNQTDDTIKESDAYLFGADEPINNPVGPTGNPGGADATTAAMRAAAGLPPAK